MLLDTHLHLIYRKKLHYPWLSSAPPLNHDATLEQYQRTARRVGITGALHMEVDVAPDDIEAETAMINSLMETPDSLLQGAIASCRPESDDFTQYLDRQRQRPEVKGFRRVLHVVPDELSTTSLFRDNIKQLSNTGYTFDLCVLPGQLPIAMELIDYCPDVRFVLDHCGVPDIKSHALYPWSDYISQVAERPNVTAKISGVMAYGDPDSWTLDTLRPYVEHTISSFGWDRIIWGSDSPVCTLGGNIETWVAATHVLVSGCSATEKAAFFHQNARKLWSL